MEKSCVLQANLMTIYIPLRLKLQAEHVRLPPQDEAHGGKKERPMAAQPHANTAKERKNRQCQYRPVWHWEVPPSHPFSSKSPMKCLLNCRSHMGILVVEGHCILRLLLAGVLLLLNILVLGESLTSLELDLLEFQLLSCLQQ